MNKKELILSMMDMPDTYKVSIQCGFDARDPAGLHQIVSVIEHKEISTIELNISED